MPRCGHYPDSARVRNREQLPKIKGTPGTQPWKDAVISDLRQGFGVEDIAMRQDCRLHSVRNFVADLRKSGMLEGVYAEARGEWRSVGSIAQKLVERAGSKP